MMFLHIWLSLTFLQTLIFIILLLLPTLFFTLKYHCHYSHGINWHPLTTTGEMLSQHGWQHLEKPILFSLLYCFWHLSLHHAYINNLVFHSLHSLVFPVSQCVKVPITFTFSLPLRHGKFCIHCWNGQFPKWGQPILHQAHFSHSCPFWTTGKFYLRNRFLAWT